MADEGTSEPAGPDREAPEAPGEVEGTPPHDGPAAGAPAAPPSTRLFDHDTANDEAQRRERKARRRERDARAEKTAFRVLALGALLVGALALGLVTIFVEPGSAPSSSPKAVAPTPPRPGPVTLVANPENVPSIEALNALRREGLTIIAAGGPHIVVAEGSAPSAAAALQSCRYAYGVWEFTPNETFRFLTTCRALRGEVLVGSYIVDGTKIRMSPLVSGASDSISVFEVQNPSKMRTEVTYKGKAPVQFVITQRVTGMQPGMDGDRFFANFARRNTQRIAPPSSAPRPSGAPGKPQSKPKRPAKPKAPGGGDPLLDLLRGGNH